MNDHLIGFLILAVMCGGLWFVGIWALRKGLRDGAKNPFILKKEDKEKEFTCDEWEHEKSLEEQDPFDKMF